MEISVLNFAANFHSSYFRSFFQLHAQHVHANLVCPYILDRKWFAPRMT